ncbi:hypothetical protein GmHk_01G000741 [Glycine max]|nr:hypothetical protein GmHk_01G000741 [Glycine max]
MATPPSSPPPPTGVASQLPFIPVGAKRPLVHVDPVTRKADGPHNKKLRTYLGIIARDKLDVTYENWKQVPAAQKDLIWEDIQRTKKKIHQIMGERWRQFMSDLTLKWALAADKESVDDTVCQKRNRPNFARVAETLRWRCAEKGTGHLEAKHYPPRVISWGLCIFRKEVDG